MSPIRIKHKTILLMIVLACSHTDRCNAGDSLLEQFLPARDVEAKPEEIETDRDSFTPATTLVEPSRVMVESAWSFIDNRAVPETNSLPELLIRYGVSDRLELRFGANYEIGGESSDVSHSGGHVLEPDEATGELEEESNVNYGLKYDLTDQDHWVPDSAIILTGSTPTSGAEQNTQFLGVFVFGWELENECVFDASIRYGTGGDGDNSIHLWAPSAVLKVPLGEKLAAHAEYFGIFSDGPDGELEKHYLSPGIHCTVTPDIEVGIRVGWGLNEAAANFFSNVGVGLLY